MNFGTIPFLESIIKDGNIKLREYVRYDGEDLLAPSVRV